jgi:hypothetical protein
MIAADTPHEHAVLDREKHHRVEQLKDILRRLNPELTAEQLEKLLEQFRQRSGLIDS